MSAPTWVLLGALVVLIGVGAVLFTNCTDLGIIHVCK